MAVATNPSPRTKRRISSAHQTTHAHAEPQEFKVRSRSQRITGGILRRIHYWAQRVQGPVRYDHAERSLNWLCTEVRQVLDHTAGASPIWQSPGMLERAREILCAYGQRDTVQRIEQFQQTLSNAANDIDESPSIGLAQDAVRLYQRGDCIAAEAAMSKLRRMQQKDGSFCSAADDHSAKRHRISTVMSFLEAAQLQVTVGIAENDTAYDTIDASDERAVAVRDWFMAIDDHGRVADIGCGRGRYLKLLTQSANPQQLVGVDPDKACLEGLPIEIEARGGNLLDIPAGDGEFAASFAVESLEHCLAPQTAVDELCRVVRPGGHILIIDKKAHCQPLSQHAPWERWFHPQEVSHWLSQHCDQVSCAPLEPHKYRRGRETFLAWHGRRFDCDAQN